MEIFYKLTSAGAQLEGAWTSFLFNLEDLKRLKELQANLILQLLAAGSRFLGSGWSPERARDKLYALCGCFLQKPQVQPYINIWLCTIALVTGAPFPLQLSQDEAAATFALAGSVNKSVERQEFKEQPPHLKFPPCNKEEEKLESMLKLWQRAEKGAHPIAAKALLQRWPRVSGLPAHAPRAQIARDAPLQDSELERISEKVLNLLHIQTHFLERADRQAQLEC